MSDTTGPARGTATAPRILILGGGYVGLYAALRLQSKLRPSEATITVIDPQPHMTYQPFLPEAAAGNISPRHAVVPLRRELKRCRIVSGEVTKVEHARKTVTVQPHRGPDHRDARTTTSSWRPARSPAPCRSPACASAASASRPSARPSTCATTCSTGSTSRPSPPTPRCAEASLTFVFVGGGYAGIEALAEMEDVVRDALKYYPEHPAEDLRFVLVEATNRILPEVGPDMGAYAARQLRQRGIDIRLEHPAGVLRRRRGASSPTATEFRAETLVWTAGVKPSPMLDAHRPAARPPRATSPACPRCRSSTATGCWTAPGAPATAPRCPT